MNTTPTIWVTQSGNGWGTSGNVFTTTTDKWTEEDWEAFEGASSDRKWHVFMAIARKHGEKVNTLTV